MTTRGGFIQSTLFDNEEWPLGIFQATKSNIDWFARYIGVGPRFVYPEVIPTSYFASTVANHRITVRT